MALHLKKLPASKKGFDEDDSDAGSAYASEPVPGSADFTRKMKRRHMKSG
jgi:hypothetical protein